jgi:hypothetical protein
VVHRQKQHVLVFFKTEQRGAQERAAREVEGARRFFGREAARFGVAQLRREGSQVNAREFNRQLRRDDLRRLAFDLGEARAQRFVARDHSVERALKRRHVEPSAQADGGRHVVSRALRLQLLQEPEALLRERRGDDKDFLHRHG